MSVGERIKERLAAHGMSQSELARRVQLTQPAINALIRGSSRTSLNLHRIARELHTTPAYLSGEIDDPDEGAPSPIPAPRHQPVMLPVMLPAEAALAAAFRGVLLASEDMDQDELAHELARRLPTVLRLSAESRIVPASVADDELPEPDEPPADARRERRRA